MAYLIFLRLGTEGGARREDVTSILLGIFSMLTSICPLTQLVWSLGLGCHQDQLYLLMASWLDTTPNNLAEELEAMTGWMKER